MQLPADDYVVMLRVGDPGEVRLIRGDITEYHSDAIVNAANSDLLPGGGVCGAIHFKGGPEIARECGRLLRLDGPVPPGGAVATTAGRLTAKHVIHAVGPVWEGGFRGEAEILASAYQESIDVADNLKLASIAFPAISTGIYGYPLKEAAEISVATLAESVKAARHVVLASIVLFDRKTLDTFASAALNFAAANTPLYEVSIGILHA